MGWFSVRPLQSSGVWKAAIQVAVNFQASHVTSIKNRLYTRRFSSSKTLEQVASGLPTSRVATAKEYDLNAGSFYDLPVLDPV